MTDLTRLTAAELATSLASGEISSVEATRAHLDRIAAVDADIHAFLHVSDQALEVGALRDVGGHGDGLAAVGADLADDLVELLHPAGAERDRKAVAGKPDRGRLADTGGGTGHQRGSPFGQGIKSGHLRQEPFKPLNGG